MEASDAMEGVLEAYGFIPETRAKQWTRLSWRYCPLIWNMRHAWRRHQWKRAGRPMVHYDGFHCGCCGRWHGIPFEIPLYESVGKQWDTWGLCPEGTGCASGG